MHASLPGLAVPHQFGVALLAHQLGQLGGGRTRTPARRAPCAEVADVHHQCRSWPPGPQPRRSYSPIDDQEHARVVGPVDPVVRPPDRQLPAHVRLGLQRLAALPQRQDVQRAARAAREARPVLEDAGAVDGPGLPLAVLVVLGDPAVRACPRAWCCHDVRREPRDVPRRPASRRPRRRSARPACSSRRPRGPAWMPWQPLPKMQVQREVSQVRSQRKTCSSSAGSGNSTHARAKSRPFSSATSSSVVAGGSAGFVRGAIPSVDVAVVRRRREPLARSASVRQRAVAFASMRLGVLDVGSNTVHLLVVDAHPGARPLPAYSHKAELRLAELLDDGRRDRPATGVDRLVAVVAGGAAGRRGQGRRGRAAVRHLRGPRGRATREEVLARVRDETGVELQVLTGEDEARLTFLAARRWFGWSAGQAAGPRHRRRLAGDRLRHRRGAGRGGLAAAGRGPADRGLAARRPARRGRTCGRCAATCAPRSPARSASSARFGTPDHVVGHVQDLQAAGPDRGRRPLRRGPVRAARAEPRVTWRSGCRGSPR